MSHSFKPGEKSIHALTIVDFDATPVWDIEQWVAGGIDSTVVPLHGHDYLSGFERYPWIRVHGCLADGTPVQAIANINFKPVEIERPSLLLLGKWHTFFLPPAPDFVLAKQGPSKLARELGREVEAVFPITLVSEVPYLKGGALVTTVFHTEGARNT